MDRRRSEWKGRRGRAWARAFPRARPLCAMRCRPKLSGSASTILSRFAAVTVLLPFDPGATSDIEALDRAAIALRGGLLEQAVACARLVSGRAAEPTLRCEALRLLSNAHRLLCAWDDAIAAAQREVAEADAAGLPDRVAEGLNAHAAVHLTRFQLDEARSLLQRALQSAADPRLLGVVWQNLGLVEAQTGQPAAAEIAFQRSLGYFDLAGDHWGAACTLINQGCLRLDQGEHEGAAAVFARAEQAARAANDMDLVAGALMNGARALFHLGRLEEAQFRASSATGFFVSSQMSLRYAECLLVLGDIEQARGADAIAQRCWQRGLATAERLGARGLRDELRGRLARITSA